MIAVFNMKKTLFPKNNFRWSFVIEEQNSGIRTVYWQINYVGNFDKYRFDIFDFGGKSENKNDVNARYVLQM